MKKRSFTLVELLVVIGIILVLAGLLYPAISGAQKRSRITHAKSDMASISTALAALAADNGGNYLVSSVKSGKSGSTSYQWGNGSGKTEESRHRVKFSDAAAAWVIWELSSPDHSDKVKNNKRKTRYLDPSSGYDGGTPSASNLDEFWPDPWGKPYVIMFHLNGEEYMEAHDSGQHKIYNDVAIYSCGPNGNDDSGCNVEDDNHGTKTADDVATWHK